MLNLVVRRETARLLKVKAIPLQTSAGPDGSRRLRLPDFRYSFLLEAESTPGP
jgi:hypothetical protein